jgi:predicted CXXCH cytochrome family protein
MGRRKNHTFLVLVPVLAIFVLGCSPRTLSVFFDGVPNPADTIPVFADNEQNISGVPAGQTAATGETDVKYYFHSPYQEKECTSCHKPNSIGQLIEQPPALCFQCHEDFSTTFKNLHAPVEMGECLTCHKPHMADNRFLLIETVGQLCFECHDQDEISRQEQHEHIKDNRCTDCHNPHGSDDQYLLK